MEGHLAARRVPAFVSGRQRCGQRGLAGGVPENLSRTRHPPVGNIHSGRRHAAFLDDAVALPQSELERLGAGPLHGAFGQDGALLPGHPDRDLHGAAAPALAREHRQAPGEGPQDLPARLRHPARAYERRRRHGAPGPPPGGCLVGGVCPRDDPADAAAGGGVFLEDPLRRRAGPAGDPSRAPIRLRVQVQRSAADNPLRPHGRQRLAARSRLGGLSGRIQLSYRREDHRHAAG